MLIWRVTTSLNDAEGHTDFEYWGGGVPDIPNFLEDIGPAGENLHGAIFASADLTELFYKTFNTHCCN